MYLSVSNIIWGSNDLEGHLRLLESLGCDGVEIAPSLVWEEPIKATSMQRQALKKMVVEHGLVIVGIHSLFYTRPDLVLFGDTKTRQRMAEYTKELIYLCCDLGGKTLVFGSPNNRRRGKLSVEEALEISTEFFRNVAEAAEACGAFLCIEPLGPDEADFITSSRGGMELISRVNHPHFRLHLDAKALITCQENYAQVFSNYAAYLKHFHVGDPGLAPPGSTGADHAPIGEALRASGYRGFISLEVRRGFGPSREVIKRSVRYVRRYYFGDIEPNN